MADIVISELSVTYFGTEEPALHQVDLHIPAGTLCAVVGANGAGKSTLCAALRGFVPQLTKAEVSGSVRIGAHDPGSTPLGDLARDVGYAFQNPFTQMSGIAKTVRDELAFGLGNLGVPPQEIRSRVAQVAARAGLTQLLERDPLALSGGQQQRVALASVLVMEPQTLIIDEPTSQLDPASTEEVFALIASMKQERTIVLVEHTMEHIAAHADMVLVLDRGRIALQGSPQQVFDDPRAAELGLRLPPAVTLARDLGSEGLPVSRTPADPAALVAELRRLAGPR